MSHEPDGEVPSDPPVLDLFDCARPPHLLDLEAFLGGSGHVTENLIVAFEEVSPIVDDHVLLTDVVDVTDFLHGDPFDFGYGSYEIAPVRDGRAGKAPDGVVVLGSGEYDERVVVGEYRRGTLVVDAEHRGRGLGQVLVLGLAVLRGGSVGAKEFTAEGLRCHQRAHALAVRLAAEMPSPSGR